PEWRDLVATFRGALLLGALFALLRDGEGLVLAAFAFGMALVEVTCDSRRAGYSTVLRRWASGARGEDYRAGFKTTANARFLSDDAQADDADQNQIDRNDIVQQPRHQQNQDTCDQGHDRLNMSNAQGHGMFPRVTDRDAFSVRRKSFPKLRSRRSGIV